MQIYANIWTALNSNMDTWNGHDWKEVPLERHSFWKCLVSSLNFCGVPISHTWTWSLCAAVPVLLDEIFRTASPNVQVQLRKIDSSQMTVIILPFVVSTPTFWYVSYIMLILIFGCFHSHCSLHVGCRCRFFIVFFLPSVFKKDRWLTMDVNPLVLFLQVSTQGWLDGDQLQRSLDIDGSNSV